MTVNTTNITSGPYTGNDVADAFSYTFTVQDKSQLKIFETDDQGVQTTLIVDTDYTVNSVGVDGGGTITRAAGALPTGYTWYIRSNYSNTQDAAFSSQGGFYPDVHEEAFDKLTYLIQQALDVYNRGFRLSDSIEVTGNLTLVKTASERASRRLQFDDAGNLTVSDGPATSVADTLFSSFTETVGERSGKLLSFNVSGEPVSVDANDSGAIDVRFVSTDVELAALTPTPSALAVVMNSASNEGNIAFYKVVGAAYVLQRVISPSTIFTSPGVTLATTLATFATKPKLTTTARKALSSPSTGDEVYDTNWDTTFTWVGDRWQMTPFTKIIPLFRETNNGNPIPLLDTIGPFQIKGRFNFDSSPYGDTIAIYTAEANHQYDGYMLVSAYNNNAFSKVKYSGTMSTTVGPVVNDVASFFVDGRRKDYQGYIYKPSPGLASAVLDSFIKVSMQLDTSSPYHTVLSFSGYDS